MTEQENVDNIDIVDNVEEIQQMETPTKIKKPITSERLEQLKHARIKHKKRNRK